jgi:hypothetical protein
MNSNSILNTQVQTYLTTKSSRIRPQALTLIRIVVRSGKGNFTALQAGRMMGKVLEQPGWPLLQDLRVLADSVTKPAQEEGALNGLVVNLLEMGRHYLSKNIRQMNIAKEMFPSCMAMEASKDDLSELIADVVKSIPQEHKTVELGRTVIAFARASDVEEEADDLRHGETPAVWIQTDRVVQAFAASAPQPVVETLFGENLNAATREINSQIYAVERIRSIAINQAMVEVLKPGAPMLRDQFKRKLANWGETRPESSPLVADAVRLLHRTTTDLKLFYIPQKVGKKAGRGIRAKTL